MSSFHELYNCSHDLSGTVRTIAKAQLAAEIRTFCLAKYKSIGSVVLLKY